MKFLKINAKVLLILCLFSGILFLSTGCGDKETESNKTGTESTEKDKDKDKDTTDKDSSRNLHTGY